MIACTEGALKVMGKDKEGQGGGVIIATASITGKHGYFFIKWPESTGVCCNIL